MCNIFIKNQHLQHLNKIKLCDYIDFLYPFIKVIWYLSVSSLRSHKPQVYGSFITIWGERAFTHPKEIASLRRQRSLWRVEVGRVSRSPTTFNISLRESGGGGGLPHPQIVINLPMTINVLENNFGSVVAKYKAKDRYPV